jgi:hypothetical protein
VRVVAVVPAKDRADSVAATVSALRGLDAVERVLVVDDGSRDDTAAPARAAGADVLRLPVNRGKGAAVAAGIAAAPEAEVFLLIDADLAGTAAVADALLAPVLDDRADLAIGVLPAAGSRAGFGMVRTMAARGIRRACGVEVRAPLSGQRAVRAELVRDLQDAERFGLEVAMTIDVARAGARVVEVDVAMDHRHTGRSLAGFTHRGRQGLDIARALWPRLVPERPRLAVIAALFAGALIAMFAVAGWVAPSSVPPAERPERVVIVGVPRWGLDDVRSGLMPETDQLLDDGGALAAMSVRTRSTRATPEEGYASINAGTRISARPPAALAYRPDAALEGATAAEVAARRTGQQPSGDIIVPSVAEVIRGAGADVSSVPGALGDALRRAGIQTGVVGSADAFDETGVPTIRRPAAAALMTRDGSVVHGVVDGEALLMPDPAAPFGVRADPARTVDATMAALEAGARVLVVDPGDTDRSRQYDMVSSRERAEQARRDALRSTDRIIGELARSVGSDTLVLVVGLTPPTATWELTPVLASGSGVVPGYLHSTSTKRVGLVTLTDVTTTVLDAFGLPREEGMIGAALRYKPGQVDVDALRDQNAHATGREGIYFPMAMTFIVVQALGYLFAILVLSQGAARGGVTRFLEMLVLSFASWPLATFALRAVPDTYRLGGGAQLVLIGTSIGIALVASRAKRHPLSPLAWIAGTTVVVMLADVATGANLQMSSVLGYSPHTAARFTGFGNTAFAVIAATAVLAAAIHVHYAPRRRDALVTAAGFLGLVTVAVGAPSLGADVGGILTLVPVCGLVLWSMLGRALTLRAVVIAGVATVAAFLLAAGVDLLRGPTDRTHLGDFVAGLLAGESDFLTTISRKWATNMRVFRATIWTWMVPITAVFLIYVLVIGRGWRRLLPPGSALRAGIIGCLAAGILGWLVNDSGVVVTALAFVYAGPYLTLLALEQDRAPLDAAAEEPGDRHLASADGRPG